MQKKWHNHITTVLAFFQSISESSLKVLPVLNSLAALLTLLNFHSPKVQRGARGL